MQRLLFAGQDVVSTVMIRGHVDPSTAAVDGVPLDVISNADVRADFDRVLRSTTDTIGILNILLWLMAAGIVAAIVYVGVLERTSEFATLKAMGTTNRALFGGLVLQAAAIAVVGAAASVVVAWAVSPLFGFPVTVPARRLPATPRGRRRRRLTRQPRRHPQDHPHRPRTRLWRRLMNARPAHHPPTHHRLPTRW